MITFIVASIFLTKAHHSDNSKCRQQSQEHNESDEELQVWRQDLDDVYGCSNSNKMAKAFIGGGREVLGVGLVEDRLPPVKQENLEMSGTKPKAF